MCICKHYQNFSKQVRPFAAVALVSLVLLTSACEFSKSGTVPAYLSVDSLIPADEQGNREVDYPEGVFPDLALFIDDKPYGTYELGVDNVDKGMVVPLTGTHKIVVYGVVRADGRRSARVNYPFYKGDSSVRTLTPESRLDLGTLILREYNRTARPIVVNFEDSSVAKALVNSGPYGTTRLEFKKDSMEGGLYWKKGGFVLLRSSAGQNKTFEIASRSLFDVPQKTNEPLYAEVDYRSNTPFTVGLYNASKTGAFDVVLAASPDKWKRAYIFLADEAANSFTQGTSLRVAVRGLLDTTKANYLAIDNIRLLHYK